MFRHNTMETTTMMEMAKIEKDVRMDDDVVALPAAVDDDDVLSGWLVGWL